MTVHRHTSQQKIVSAYSCTKPVLALNISKMRVMQVPEHSPPMRFLTAKDLIYQKVLGKFWVQRQGWFDQTFGWRSNGCGYVSMAKTVKMELGKNNNVPRRPGLFLLDWNIFNLYLRFLWFLEDVGDFCSSRGGSPILAALKSGDVVEICWDAFFFVDVMFALLLVHVFWMHSPNLCWVLPRRHFRTIYGLPFLQHVHPP